MSTSSAPAGATVFDATRAWRIHPQVALREESFGALAYHFGNRRLTFLKSRTLVELVGTLDHYDSAREAVAALVPADKHRSYERALARLADLEVIDVR